MTNKQKATKKRAEKYEEKLKIHSTFEQAMKVLVSDSKAQPPKQK